MKKIFVLATLAASLSANAMDVSLSNSRDFNLDKNAVRVETSLPVAVLGVSPTLSATRVDNVYTRYAVGAQANLAKVGPVSLAVTGAGVYQDTSAGANGYGLTVGVKGSVPVAKNLDLVATVDRFLGQDRVRTFNGTQAALGLRVKF
jgi:hypothetical protein